MLATRNLSRRRITGTKATKNNGLGKQAQIERECGEVYVAPQADKFKKTDKFGLGYGSEVIDGLSI